ncbi:MAG: winged helix-turn-helix transcriptional regulator [Hamadaea sp.]|nr:winged helix-turn-helix transcriptional regulator [Hamadaea sp.]
MLRIYFSGDDVARVRIAPAADPLWEVVLSIHMLRGQPGDLLFADWRRSTATALRDARLGPGMGLLSALTPNIGYFPDFLNPIVPGHQLANGLEAIRRTPVAVLDNDLQRLAPRPAVLRGVRALADGDPKALVELTDAMQTYYRLAIEPHRRVIDAAIEHDRARRIRALAEHGVEGLLGSLRPMMEYSDGELRVPMHADQEIHLDGRGLLLIPTYFGIHNPMTMFDENLVPVLIYPVERRHDLLPEADPSRRNGLASLIGPTRSAILAATAIEGRTTSDLARRVGISAGSASEQTTVLREAGLLISHRDGNRVIHHITPLGAALLNGRG